MNKKLNLDDVPSYLILEKASKIVFDYSYTKRPRIDNTEDDFMKFWHNLEQISTDLDKLVIVDKSLNTIRDFKKD